MTAGRSSDDFVGEACGKVILPTAVWGLVDTGMRADSSALKSRTSLCPLETIGQPDQVFEDLTGVIVRRTSKVNAQTLHPALKHSLRKRDCWSAGFTRGG